MVLARAYFDMMLRGEKQYEIRCQLLSQGVWHVGHHGQIYGVLTLGAGFVVDSEARWLELRPLHRHPALQRPYKHTCALPVLNPQLLTSTIGYVHRQGSIGCAKFEPVAGGAISTGTLCKPKY